MIDYDSKKILGILKNSYKKAFLEASLEAYLDFQSNLGPLTGHKCLFVVNAWLTLFAGAKGT